MSLSGTVTNVRSSRYLSQISVPFNRSSNVSFELVNACSHVWVSCQLLVFVHPDISVRNLYLLTDLSDVQIILINADLDVSFRNQYSVIVRLNFSVRKLYLLIDVSDFQIILVNADLDVSIRNSNQCSFVQISRLEICTF